jgi:hypothetical protein
MSDQTTPAAEHHDFSWTSDGHTPKIDVSLPKEKYRLIMVAQAKARRDAS